MHWILWVFSIKYCHSSRKIVRLQTEFKMKRYIIMAIHQCDYRGGWKINCLSNSIPAHVFSIYAVSLYTIYTGCFKRLCRHGGIRNFCYFHLNSVFICKAGNTMLIPDLVLVRCCTIKVRNQFASLKCEQWVNTGEKRFSVTSLVNEKYGFWKGKRTIYWEVSRYPQSIQITKNLQLQLWFQCFYMFMLYLHIWMYILHVYVISSYLNVHFTCLCYIFIFECTF